MSAESFKRKLTAILSADVKGYSRLMGENEAETVKTLTAYRKIMGELIQQHRGRVIDSPGDNILAEFASVVDAVQCSVAAQNEFKARNAELPDNRRMEFRIGVNLGDVIEEEGRIYGDGVNIAARLEALADPGGICISKTAFDHIESKLPLGYQFLGEQTVKNIAKPVGAYKVLMEPRVVPVEEKNKAKKVTFWQRKSVLAGAFAVLVVVIGLGVWNFYLRTPKIEPASKDKMAFPLPNKPSIAVLPFANMTGDASQEFLVDGLTETIITALARVPQLFVIARESSFSYKGKEGVKVQQVAEELGVQYVLEGSVQRSGNKVRVTAQFIDALKGRHLWAAQYDRDMKDLFQLTDDVTAKVLPSVYLKLTGGGEGRLSRWKGPKDTEAFLKCLELIESMRGLNPKDNARAKRLAEELTTMDPEWSMGPSMLARAYFMDVFLGVSDSPKESLAKALELAKKAVAMDASNPTNYNTLGYVLSMMKENEQALAEFEKASTLCPSCSDPYIYIGYIQYCMDETDKAIESLQTALRLNPYPPSYYYGHLGNAYRHAGRYEEAIPWYKKSLQLSPNAQGSYVGLITSYSLLGREEEARAAAQELLRVNPKFSVEVWAKTMPYKNGEKLALFADALRKAGLPDQPPIEKADPNKMALPLPDLPSIAVLPFVNMSGDPKQEFLSDGITEEITTALSKVPQLFVISRESSFSYKGKHVKVKQVSEELGVQYVLEGSVQRSSDRIRINAQLIDALTGRHVWSDRFDRDLKDLFALQDEITLKILTAMRVKLTEGEQASSWEKYFRGKQGLDCYLKMMEVRNYLGGHNMKDLQMARPIVEEVIAICPENPMSFGTMAYFHWMEYWLGPVQSRRESIEKGIQMAQKAIAMDDSIALAHSLLGMFYNLTREYDKAIAEGERALALDPGGVRVNMGLAMSLYYVDRSEEAIQLFQKAIRLDPIGSTGLYLNFANALKNAGRFEEAISAYKKSIQRAPDNIFAHIGMAVTYIMMGREEEARAQGAEVLRINPNFSVDSWARLLPFKDQSTKDRVVNALRKTGLK
jgi:adenylate cyclase